MIFAEPIEMAVSLVDARNAARINGTDFDAEIAIRVRALTAEAEHITGRAIINRTHRLTFSSFPAKIYLPESPAASVISVKYFDPEGVERTLNPIDWYLDAASEPGYIMPSPGKAWPATLARTNAVTVLAVCGYGPDHTTTPAAFKGYVLAKVREYFAPPGTPESPYLIRGLESLKVHQ